MALPVYSARNVQVVYDGLALEGLAPDSFVEFSLNSDLTDEEVGGDGSVSISISPDNTGTCTISLQQSSPSNIILAGVLNAQRVQGDIIRGALVVKDPSGSVLAGMIGAHIKTAPTTSLGSTATGKTKDWVFFIENIAFTAAPEGLLDGIEKSFSKLF